MNSKISSTDELEASLLLSRLQEITEKVRRIASYCAAITFLNLFVALFVGVAFSRLRRLGDEITLSVSAYSLSLTVFAIGALYLFDRHRNSGDAVFQELSDELEWSPYPGGFSRNWRGVAHTSPPDVYEVPRATVRVSIREYLVASTLPMVGRESSTRIYLILNFMSAVVVSILMGISI